MSVTLDPVSDIQEAEDPGVRVRRWTVKDFFRAVNMGFFKHPERLELINGEVIERMAAQNAPHFAHVRAVAITMGRIFGSGNDVRQQGPFHLSEADYTEPDVLVVGGSYIDYAERDPTPADVRLLVEVSDTTLRLDRSKKAALYARHGIQDYWILNLNERCLEVHRDPLPMPDSRYGFGYKTRIRYTEDETVSPLAAPQAAIRISDLLLRVQTTVEDKG